MLTFRLTLYTGLTPTCGLEVEKMKNGASTTESNKTNAPPPCASTFLLRGCGEPKGCFARAFLLRKSHFRRSRLMFSSLSQSCRSRLESTQA